MKISPHLTFKGQCEEAFELYARVLGGTIEMRAKYGEMPMSEQLAPEMIDRVAHIQLTFDGHEITGCDVPQEEFVAPRGISLLVNVDTEDDARRVFEALSQDGATNRELEETFWARSYGEVQDRFGIFWMVNCQKPEMRRQAA